MELWFLDLFLLVAQLLSGKYKQVANFVSFVYLVAITKLKLKCLSIKSISFEKFDELLAQNSYKFNFFGDPHSCALLSINTLVALSMSNKACLKITRLVSDSEEKEETVKGDGEFSWRIEMPPVVTQENNSSKNYFIQCLCVSGAPRDFVLYVHDAKLFNIINCLQINNLFRDLLTEIKVEYDVECSFPCMAKTAVVSGVATADDVSITDFEAILDEYFITPKLVRINDIIQVNLSTFGDHLRSRPSLCNVLNVYFKVINLKGESDIQMQYVMKGYTNLYLNPSVHSYLPPKRFNYIKTVKNMPSFEISICPDGLLQYFDKIKKIIKFLIDGGNIEGMLLLSGAKGSGKKTIIKAVCSFFGLNFIQINCFDFYGMNSSIVQGKLNQIFTKARISVPSVVYFENVELIGRDQNHHVNARLVDAFETQIKELWIRKPNSYPLVVVGSTQLQTLEMVPAIDRLFIHVISFDSPKVDEVYLTLKWLLKSSNMICSSNDVRKVAEKVRGYVFGDLVLLIQHAIHIHSQDSSQSDSYLTLNFDHFKKAIEIMEAAYSDSIGAAKVPTVNWEDIGGLGELKEEVILTLNLPIKHPELFASGLKRSGILFYGPPGTGKTLMAKAIATECNYNFLSVKGPELMNMYVGQSEKNIREVFERAREASPCIIFFDELDSLAPSRDKSGDSGGVTDRVVSQLLAEMDGLEKNKHVFVVAATNRPDLIDQALLRPGRFDKMFYVGVCKDKDSKLSVIKALTRRFNLGSDVDFEKVIEELPPKVTGADLYSVCSNAWFAAARRAVHALESGTKFVLPLEVFSNDFFEAVSQFVPSLTSQNIDYYENLNSSGAVK